jgi:outer membrane protein assembly factor BamB
MRAFQIVIDRKQRSAARTFSTLQGVVDVLVDGTNVTARIGQDHALPLLRDLAFAAVELATGRCSRTTVRFYDQRDAWALGLEAVGEQALLTVFQAGATPQVAVFERQVRGDALVKGMVAALGDVLDRQGAPAPVAADLATARKQLEGLSWKPSEAPEVIEARAEGHSEAPLCFAATFGMRDRPTELAATDLERNDLHSLLPRGKFELTVGDYHREIGDTFVFLVAETLVREAAEVLDGWVGARAVHHRSETAGVFITTRLTTDGTLTLTFGGPRTGGLRNASSFPAITVPGFVESVVMFARAVARAIVRHDRSQTSNLRMRVFRDAVRDLAEELRESVRSDSKVNEAPDSYRAYADALPSRAPAPPWHQGRLRFVNAWQAAVPGVDLNSTFLIGEHVLVGGARELACIDRASGAIRWRSGIDKGVSVAAPDGIARLSPEGMVTLYDLETGDITTRVRLAARVGGMPAGAIVNAPGLPKLLVVSEGERHITAIDLVSGEVRWRHALGRGRFFKVRRAGRLLIVSSSEPTLTAVDAASGAMVWRVRDRLRFCRPAAYEASSLFVVAGDPGPALRSSEALLALDPWTGMPRWRQDLPSTARVLGAPMPAESVVVLAVHDHKGTGFLAFDRNSGSLSWSVPTGYAPSTSAWLIVDDMLVTNGAQGEVSALQLSTGKCAWQKRMGKQADTDVPRHLEPVLRAGALFVPQQQVHVMRPQDGEPLGTVPCELVPDLVRVDERCNVLIVEDSGHIASFHAGARLTLIKN